MNEIEPEHTEKINQWLAQARQTGIEEQFFTNTIRDDSSEYMYSYVYGKGYTDYEVSFLFNSKEPTNKGQIHVAGFNKNSTNDSFVQIKSINDLSILFVLSEESLRDKLTNGQ